MFSSKRDESEIEMFDMPQDKKNLFNCSYKILPSQQRVKILYHQIATNLFKTSLTFILTLFL